MSPCEDFRSVHLGFDIHDDVRLRAEAPRKRSGQFSIDNARSKGSVHPDHRHLTLSSFLAVIFRAGFLPQPFSLPICVVLGVKRPILLQQYCLLSNYARPVSLVLGANRPPRVIISKAADELAHARTGWLILQIKAVFGAEHHMNSLSERELLSLLRNMLVGIGCAAPNMGLQGRKC